MRLLARVLLVVVTLALCAPGALAQPFSVARDIQKARLIKSVPPQYPPLARKARIQGTVRLQAVIGRDGKVAQLEVISGHPLLVETSLEAVRQWEYQPTLFNGAPVEASTTIDVVFTLEDKPGEEPPPSEAEQFRQRIAGLMRESRFEDVVGELRNAAEKKPEDAAIRQQIVQMLMMLGRYDEAIAELRDALRYKPDSVPLRSELLGVLLEADRVHEAISEFHEIRRYGEPPAKAIGQMGMALHRTQPAETAEAEFRLLLQDHSNPGDAHLMLAQELMMAGRFDAALYHVTEAARLKPEDKSRQLAVQQFRKIRDVITRGMEMLQQRIQQNPRQPAVRLFLALGYLVQDQWESKGRAELMLALDTGFDEQEAHQALAEVLRRRDGRAAAVKEFRELVRRFPRLPNLRLVLSQLLWDAGDRPGAIAELRNAIAAVPDRPGLRHQLADYLERLGDVGSAATERAAAEGLPEPRASDLSTLQALAEELMSTLMGDELEQARETANETSAVGMLRTINTVCVQYEATYNAGYPYALANLAPPPGGGQPSAQYADLIDPASASGTKNGYVFTYVVTGTDQQGKPNAYEVHADPVQPGTTGTRYFYTDHSGVVRVNSGGRAGPGSPVLQ